MIAFKELVITLLADFKFAAEVEVFIFEPPFGDTIFWIGLAMRFVFVRYYELFLLIFLAVYGK